MYSGMDGFGLRRFIKVVVYSNENNGRKCAPIITCIGSFQEIYWSGILSSVIVFIP